MVVVLHSELYIMKSCNLLGTMTSVGIFLCVAGRANAYAAVLHAVMLSSVEVKAPLHSLVLLPFIPLENFPAHAVSQNRHCPTNSNLWLPPVQNEKCLACTKTIFNEGHLTALLDFVVPVFSCFILKTHMPCTWILP